MGDLTKNISRHELACNCGCGADSMDFAAINSVQECCDHFADQLGVDRVMLRIHSAHRCFGYNRSDIVGSNDDSQHPQARGIDFSINGIDPADVYEYLCKRYPGKYGIGKYKTFTHKDTRTNGPARW